MVTVLIALALLAIGIAGTLVSQASVVDFISGLSLPRGLERDVTGLLVDRTIGFACLFASPMPLVIGSLLPGI